ncbi:MAG: transporter substrate-binding domain-containing protein, partial [Succinatimonas hippei]|nr:transporter substrate-binding domain-containing protein [Succinatimonas hippei]
MNKTTKRALACAVALALLGTATESLANAKDKVLHVGCEGAFAPFTYIDNGKITGFDIDLIRELGKDMGYKVEVQVYPFDGLIPAL